MAGIDKKQINAIVLSSVVPSLQAAWIECCNKHFPPCLDSPLFIVNEENVRQLITVSIDQPQDVGADRLVNSIGGWYQHKCDLIIVDFGTAITFDCVTNQCEYIGGVILPGIGISMEALASRTAKLPHIDISEPPDKVIGKNTISAMKSGVMHGYGSMIDGMVNKIKKEMKRPESKIKVLATGGMAQVISPFTNVFDQVDPELTLKGLQIIHQKIDGDD